jgi:Trypsin-like peptidase domain
VDPANDLALCRLTAKSSAEPIMLADEEPKAGSAVFALGNPKGLERTISQGLFTGHREIQGRRLVQISAPISPGSSGGPILNSEGKLIAVAVGSFSAGQNLNFAVPLAIVRTFLTPGTNPTDASSQLLSAKRLIEQRTTITYSEEPDSPYAKLDRQIRELLTRAVDGTDNLEVLEEVFSASQFFYTDVQTEAARKAIRIARPPRKRWFTNLAQALYYSTSAAGPSTELDEAETAAARAVGPFESYFANIKAATALSPDYVSVD